MQAEAGFATLPHLLFQIFQQFVMKSTVKQTQWKAELCLKVSSIVWQVQDLMNCSYQTQLSNWQEIVNLAFFLPQRRDKDAALHFSSQGFTGFIVEEEQWGGFPARR